MHVGDQAIAQIGDLLRKHLPPSSFAARISGDRFAVVMPSEMDEAAMFGEGLREGVTRLSTAHVDARYRLSISIGVTPFTGRDGELGRSLAEAESACKAAKDRGRNRLETFQENDVSIIRRFTDINVATDVRGALAENRLRLEAQMIAPFTAQQNGMRARPHYELLLRMLDPDGNTIGPDRFLSAALRYQMMPTIDRWVIASVIEMLRPRRELLLNAPVCFTINFSGQSLHDEEFADYVIRSIETSRINPAVFCFELTESAAVASINDAEKLMQRLRKLGCGVALDDFGTGLSSLSYLRSMPVSMLKIDGSFVRDILRDERAESMVRAIAQLARAMNITTVAEYVETEEIRARVRSLGVDYGQGFAIARPIPVAEVLDVLPVLAAATPGAFLVDEPSRHTGS
jgi:EAL domain-containing protein (putative c-di-GMP-specific phosphodiesterase class I)